MCKCLKCGYEWNPRVSVPKECPRCKSWSWNKEKYAKTRGTDKPGELHEPGEAGGDDICVAGPGRGGAGGDTGVGVGSDPAGEE